MRCHRCPTLCLLVQESFQKDVQAGDAKQAFQAVDAPAAVQQVIFHYTCCLRS